MIYFNDIFVFLIPRQWNKHQDKMQLPLYFHIQKICSLALWVPWSWLSLPLPPCPPPPPNNSICACICNSVPRNHFFSSELTLDYYTLSQRKLFYCTFRKHANSEVQKLTDFCVLLSIRKRKFTSTGSKGNGLWLVNFDPLCVFLCFKVRCLW